MTTQAENHLILIDATRAMHERHRQLIGDELRADALDAEIDAARARQRRDKRQPWTEMEDE